MTQEGKVLLVQVAHGQGKTHRKPAACARAWSQVKEAANPLITLVGNGGGDGGWSWWPQLLFSELVA